MTKRSLPQASKAQPAKPGRLLMGPIANSASLERYSILPVNQKRDVERGARFPRRSRPKEKADPIKKGAWSRGTGNSRNQILVVLEMRFLGSYHY